MHVHNHVTKIVATLHVLIRTKITIKSVQDSLTRKEKQNLKEATIAAIAQAVIHANQQWSGLVVLSLHNHHHHSDMENLPLHTHKSYLYCGS